MIKQSLGMIETRGFTAALQAADTMVKAADVIITSFQVVGSGFVTVLIDGDVAAVQSAVSAGASGSQRLGQLVAHHVIPRPHEEVIKFIKMMDLL